jgi:5-methyltetrahydropteroyltriglutamate--homocysteine methyltransferase
MKLSTDRILTTHVGSLPRDPKVAEMLLAVSRGESVDSLLFDIEVGRAVSEVVAKQVASGIDVASDGEMSKLSYSTYITDRLTGFGGSTERKPNLDVAPYPEFREKMSRMTGPQAIARAACIGPIQVKDRQRLVKDLQNLRVAADAASLEEVFMTAASPGVISVFQPNQYYSSHEKYIEALANVMKEEYEAIVGAGFLLQVDCPDLAMAHHTAFQDLPEACRGSGGSAELRTDERARRVDSPTCVLGELRRPARQRYPCREDHADPDESETAGLPV